MNLKINTKSLVFALTMISSFSFSQAVMKKGYLTNETKEIPILKKEKAHTQNSVLPKSEIVWENDFSNESDWEFSNNSSPDRDWEITSTWPGIGGFDPPNFATANNGYALINSDEAGEGATQNADLIISNSIDLSSYNDITIEFSQYMRRWNTSSDQFYLGFSVDDGETWDEVEINTDLGGNETSANPELFSLNISNIAGNVEKFKFKFKYIGAWGWFWTVDDVRIIVPEDYDLASTDPKHYAGNISTFDEDLSDGLDYYKIPESQITNLNFSALVSNQGNLNQTQATLNLEVFHQGSHVFNETSNSFTINSGEESRVFLDKDYTPSEEGVYSFKIYARPDEDDLVPTNDTVFINDVVVGGNEYARDNGIRTGGFTNVAGGAGNPFSIGNLFEFFGDFTIRNVKFYVNSGIDSNNDVGKLINTRIYKLANEELEFVYESLDYTIQEEDRGNFIDIPLYDFEGAPNYVTAEAGDVFLIMVGHYGEDVVFSMAQSVEDLSVLFFDGSGELGVFGDMNAIIVRASDQCNKVVDLTKTDATACGESDGTITINIDEPAVTGHTITWDGAVSGSDDINSTTDSYFIENLPHGEYTITVEDEGGCVTESVIQVLEDGAPTISVNIDSEVSCAGKEDAVLTISSADDISDYVFTWSNGDIGNSSNVGAGNHSVSGEGLGCSTNIAHIIVEDGEKLPININQVSGVLCNGESNAVLEVTSEENISAYTFLWSNGETGTSITVGAGNYSVEGQGECGTTTPLKAVKQPSIIQVEGEIVNDIEITTSILGGTPPYTFSWFGPNGFASTEQNITAPSNGDYLLTVKDGNDCSVNSEVFKIEKVGLSDDHISHISVYPNPSNKVINFDLSAVEASQIKVLDLTGKEVINEKINSKEIIKINIENLSDGMYVYHIIDKEHGLLSSDKVVVSK